MRAALIFGYSFFAIGQDIVESTEVDVRPGEGARIFRGVKDLLEVADGRARLALHEIDSSEDIVGLSVVSFGIGEDLVGDIGGSDQVTLEDLHLGKLQAGQLCCGAAENVVTALGEEGNLPGPCAVRDPHPCRRPSGLYLP